jgi:hypothetical protein
VIAVSTATPKTWLFDAVVYPDLDRDGVHWFWPRMRS